MLILCTALWQAQTDTARLQGTALDSSGGAITGANLETNRTLTAHTNEEGAYTLPALLPGRYKVEVAKTGFCTVSREVTLQISQVANMPITLEPGSVTQSVDVTAEAAMVDSANSAIGTVVNSRQVEDLPLNGRNFTQFATEIRLFRAAELVYDSPIFKPTLPGGQENGWRLSV
jgi:hypothetical protein